jgi:hypothetical protein
LRVFKTKWFMRFARRTGVSDDSLCEAVRRAEQGLVDADLGGGIIKQRIARPGQGRSGGYRALIAYRSNARAVFFYGFAKNERENVDEDELRTARDIAGAWLAAGTSQLAKAIADRLIQEVECDDDKPEA